PTPTLFPCTTLFRSWTSRSVPPDLSPTSGVRPELQLSEAKKYSVAEDSLPMFHRKWNPPSIAAETLTSAVTVAEDAPARTSSGSSTQLPLEVFAPPRRVNDVPVQSVSRTLWTVAGPRSVAALLGTSAPSAWSKRYSTTRSSSGTAAWALTIPDPRTIAPSAATATAALRLGVTLIPLSLV